jgi:hypothetical protein
VLADRDQLRQRYEAIAVGGITRSVGRQQRHYQHNVDFVRQRFEEGLELAAHFESKYRGMPLSGDCHRRSASFRNAVACRLVAIPPPGRPRNIGELLWKLFRRLLWDRIVIYKE